MSQQAVNRESFGDKSAHLGDLVVGVRVDALPQSEADKLAAAGKFYPLTLNDRGLLRVVLPDGPMPVTTQELDVLLRIEALLEEQRDLLLRIV